MRLTKPETEAIREVVHAGDNEARIFLFGSRTYMNKKGGDIDLLVLSQKLSQRDIYKIKTQLWDRIGEQRIDIILAKDDSQPFARIALEEGIEIC